MSPWAKTDFVITVDSFAETALPYGQSQLDEILVSYAGKEIVLSDQLQVVHNDVNFRETPGGKVLGRLQGGDLLECMYELQYNRYAEMPGRLM